jgi:hypothetical protein
VRAPIYIEQQRPGCRQRSASRHQAGIGLQEIVASYTKTTISSTDGDQSPALKVSTRKPGAMDR